MEDPEKLIGLGSEQLLFALPGCDLCPGAEI
jgi:hypothetical protein